MTYFVSSCRCMFQAIRMQLQQWIRPWVRRKAGKTDSNLKLPLLPGADASRANPFDNRPEQLTFESN